ncbi:MAG: lipopolysaccharide heptosyltransferase II [Myxococcales bacterium]|nr:lipopolysaccharide heptosyltransferase II [Myxococcales bacterium]
MATPALRALRRHVQGRITLSGRPYLAPLFEGHPSIDAFRPVPARGMGALLSAARELRGEAPDWAVCFPDATRAALLPALAGIPLRIGYAREPLRRRLLTRALDPPRQNGRRVPISMIERYLRITRALGCDDAGDATELRVASSADARVRERLRAEGLDDPDGYFVMTPGASFGASKLWPPEHFAAACDQLSERLELRGVLAPGPGEEVIARAIRAAARSKPIALCSPIGGLGELVALLARTRLLVTNDTGPRHIAVALGRPVVCVIGPTDSRHTDHLLDRQRVLREDVACSPCHRKVCPIDHRCMTELRPERVVRAAEELLS